MPVTDPTPITTERINDRDENENKFIFFFIN